MTYPELIVPPGVPSPDRHRLEGGPPAIPTNGTWRERREAKAKLRRYKQSLKEYGSCCIAPSTLDEEGRALLERGYAALTSLRFAANQCDESWPNDRVLLEEDNDFGQPVYGNRYEHEPWIMVKRLLTVCPAAGELSDESDGPSREEVMAEVTAQVERVESEAADWWEYIEQHPQELTAYTE
jgi:hypothetical protein